MLLRRTRKRTASVGRMAVFSKTVSPGDVSETWWGLKKQMEHKAHIRVCRWGLWQPCLPGSGDQGCLSLVYEGNPDPEESYGLLRMGKLGQQPFLKSHI